MKIEIPYEIGEKVWGVIRTFADGHKVIRCKVLEGGFDYIGEFIKCAVWGMYRMDLRLDKVFPDSQKSAALARAKELNDE